MLHIYSYTNKGGRGNNEDYCGQHTGGNYGSCALADGLGGHDCGEVASKAAVEYILRETEKLADLSDSYLTQLIGDVNHEILDLQKRDPRYCAARTTIVAALYRDDTFRYFNVGDSRLYYFKKGCIFSQTKDHSLSQLAVDLGEITPEQIRFHDDRNGLLKVLGNEPELRITKVYKAIRIEAGDAFLLCSDGFWEYVFEAEMELDLLKSETPGQWGEHMVKRLLSRVSGNNDNYTLICGMFD